jgi:sugar lactone lactonase YvrE
MTNRVMMNSSKDSVKASPDLGTLYVTTAARRAAHEPLAGALFACRPGVTGLPATPFAG